MSILIKGMEMPTSCGDCRFCCGIADTDCGPCAWCNVDEKARVADTRQDCPLVPVPKHGRLGDLDALHKLFLEKAKEYKGAGGAMVAMAALCIANAPTIIPADPAEED